MEDFDANEDLVRLPAAGPGGRIQPAGAGPRAQGAVALASPATGGVSDASSNKASRSSRPSPGPPASAAGASSGASAPKRGAGASHGGRPPLLLDYLDVLVVVLAAVPALALGAPVLGYSVGAGAWLAQRALAEADKRWIRKASEPRTQLGLSLFEAFGRIWLLAGAIIIAGVAGGRADGLTAALVIFGAYSVAFAVKVLTGPPRPQRKVVQ
jgi:hypothetical protein